MSGGDLPGKTQTDQVDTATEQVAGDTVQTESMKLRSELMSALKEYIYRTHLSQSQAAVIFGVTQPRISDLTRGKVDLFGLDALVNMASTAGLRVEMHVRETA
ncbi:helix-turn-helix domain-containing protein [Diaphorobacter nitroreducens]|uniref:helix-turn-helix domain-containing protein n=1 Tax=Diaphorobacter nitroreducens TaxID=164759 RepID=UPI0035E3F644